MKSDLQDVDVVFQTQTEKAVCVRLTEDGKDVWVPKSQCELDPESPLRGAVCTLTASEKLLLDKGLI